jgi:ABC-type arginine/histidine transport system permease subunit
MATAKITLSPASAAKLWAVSNKAVMMLTESALVYDITSLSVTSEKKSIIGAAQAFDIFPSVQRRSCTEMSGK